MPRLLTDIQREIMRYVAHRSSAAETPQGVNSVWLKRGYTAGNVAEVEAALEALVEQGHMEKHTLPGGATLFRKADAPGSNTQGFGT
jgi:Fe2+ or Zn2+ uptake regulation protein